jgi:hypothetical protein
MKQNRMKDVLESIVQRDVPADMNLMPTIAAYLERRSLMMTLRAKPILLILVVLLTFVFLTGVVYAIGNLLGYVPGIGLVNQTVSLRILAEPVVVERDGITVTVLKMVADSEHTFVAYTVDGVKIPAIARPMCGVVPTLQLPNGSALDIIGEDDGGPLGGRVGTTIRLEQSVTYSSIPEDVDTVTFIFPCIVPEGTGPENWQIPLKLSPPPKDYATPAVEIGATFVASKPTFVISPIPTTDMRIFTPESPETLPPTLTPVPNGSGLYLEKVIELPNSYILVGTFTDAGDLPGALEVNLDPYEDLPRMEDEAGNPIPFKVRDDIQHENMQSGVRYWAYEVAKPVQGPVTITLDQVNIAKTYTFEFSFDAGANPQKGQKWALNLPVHLGSYEYIMDSVEVIENGYLFKYHSGTDVPAGVSLMFNLIGQTPEQDGSELRDGKTIVEYSEKLVFLPPLPTGQIIVDLTSMETFPLHGLWILTWTP